MYFFDCLVIMSIFAFTVFIWVNKFGFEQNIIEKNSKRKERKNPTQTSSYKNRFT